MIKIGINGFGRTGRCAMRIAMKNPGIQVVAINSRSDNQIMAHLLKYDSTYGIWPEEIRTEGQEIVVGQRRVKGYNFDDPAKIPWGEVQTDVVIESTGVFTSSRQSIVHIRGGAKKVIISAPTEDETKMVVLGVNEGIISNDDSIVSNASCTTNCLAPVVKVLDDKFKILSGFCSTVHAVTSDQQLLDKSHKDYRRARGAMESIIPTTTGATGAIGKIIPHLAGKLDGLALRVPIPTVSLIDLSCLVESSVNKESLKAAFLEAENSYLKSYLETCDRPLVSADFIGNPKSAIIDLLSLEVVDQMVKVIAWYDNEWGYSARLIDLAVYLQRFL
jgi:glyceraldehyde 3-phosphate dehydrogenase